MKQYNIILKKLTLTAFICLSALWGIAQTSITGTVFNDGNNNGVKDANDVGYPFVVVNAYAPGATTPTATATTLATPAASIGQYTINGLTTGVKYRLEFLNPNNYYNGAFATGSKSSVQFATSGATNVNFGFRFPGVCIAESNPRMIAGTTVDTRTPNLYTLKSWRFLDRYTSAIWSGVGAGPINPHSSDNLGSSTGVPFGLSTRKQDSLVFYSTVNCDFANPHWNNYIQIPSSPDGKSALYVAQYSGSGYSFQGKKLLGVLDNLGVNTNNQFPIGTETGDNIFGMSGLGGAAVSNDGKTLYVVNMGNGKIVKVNIANYKYTNSVATAITAADVSEITIPTTVTNTVNGRFRPTSLKIKGNTLYIGGVDDASTGANSDLLVKLISMNITNNSFSSVYSFVPNFPVGAISTTQGFYTQEQWNSTYINTSTIFQPVLMDFDFDDAGNLILGIGNRKILSAASYWDMGYLIKAAKTSTGYALESNGIAGADVSLVPVTNATTPLTVGPDAVNKNIAYGPSSNGSFFYPQGVTYTVASEHPFLFTGGVVNQPGTNLTVAGYTDPLSVQSFGARYLNNKTGVREYGIQLGGEKNMGLTGLEAVCDINPVEVGNLVWKDVNSNGIQDGDEPALVGVSVCLYDATNTLVSTAVTDANGNYIFSSAAGTSTGSMKYGLSLTNDADYTLKVCALGSDASVTGLSLTSVSPAPGETSGQPNSRTTLSNNDAFLVSGNPTISFKMGNPGENNHNYDIGLLPAPLCTNPNAGGDQSICLSASNTGSVTLSGTAPTTGTWTAMSGNPSGANVGTTTAGVATATFTAAGVFNFLYTDGACSDTAQVVVKSPSSSSISMNVCSSTLPYNWNGTNYNTAGTYTSTFTNSVGCDSTATLNLTITTAGSIGNYVWLDINNNGLKDEATTAGVNGVKVYLYNNSNPSTPIDSTVTSSLSGNPGYYNFVVCASGDYLVKFPIMAGGDSLTTQTTTVATDNNSDASPNTGLSPVFTINLAGTGTQVNNATIDAGYQANTICAGESYTLKADTLMTNYQWYKISGNDTIAIVGAINQIYNATDTGTYYYTALSSGCVVKLCSPVTIVPGNCCTKPDAGADATACGGTCNTLTGTNTTAGTWTAMSSNAAGATLGTTTAGVAQVCFATTASGTYNFIYTVTGGCTDTMSIVASPKPNAGNDVSTCFMSGAGTATMAATGTGTWAALSGNAGTSTITNTTSATTTITNFSAVGNYYYTWTSNGCVDTVMVSVTPNGTIGNYVWSDLNANGIKDEPTTAGINGVKVYLYNNASPSTPIDSMLTANNGGNAGYYNFIVCANGDYFVKFPTTTGTDKLTAQTATAATDNNSDANATTGMSPVFAIDVNGTGTAKDNNTIDAGYFENASLGNYVWNDVDHDGVQDANEVGVAGVTVTLYNNAGTPVSSTITDAYGHYLFENLTPADYTVGFTLPQNYVFTTTTGTSETDATNSDVNTTTGKTTTVTLSSGENQMNVDAGIFYQPQTTATVGNYVWFDTDADGVQDANEVGISGVTVTLYDNGGNPVATTITDANGGYQFTNVTPGTYTVGFTSPVGMINSPNNGAVSGTTNSDANPSTGMTTPFTVNAGDNITYVDAGFTPQPATTASLGDKVWYDVNQNGTQDNGELGVEGVTVTLYQSNGTTVVATTTTDIYGNYIFNNLAAGQYVVGFTTLPTNYVLTNTTGTNPATNSDANTATAKTSIITLSAGQHDMTWDAGIFNNVPTNNNSIGDYVWNDVDKDGVQDATEQGVAGITVTLYDNTNTPIATTSTNANGQYTFPDLPNGTYTVGFSNLPTGFTFSPIGAGTPSTDSDPNPSTGLTSSVTLLGNTHITTLDAGIMAGNPNIGTASLGDKVWYDVNNNGLQDAGEAGVQGVTVTLYQSNGTTPIATTTTNALGNYIFTGLNAGNYVVGFTNLPVGYTITSKDANAQGIEGETNSDVNTATNKTDVISLAIGQDKMSVDMGIVPPAGTAALGNFVWFDLNNDGLQTTGEPGVQGVTVTLYDNTNTAVSSTTTDANGEYHFVGLTPATYSVGFSNLPTGYTFTTASGVINDATNSDANVTTGMTATVTLASGDNNLNLDAGIKSTTVASVGDYVWNDINHDGIQDANEPGIGGVLVTLYDNSNNPVASTITNPDGSYIFTNVTPGTYTMGFGNLPSGMTFTTQETNPTSNTGSNVDPSTGLTPSFIVTAGTHNPTIDAGLMTTPLAGLGNYVWYDNNKDGEQATTETGVAGAIATLYASNGTTVLAQAITDGNGAYSFTNLPAGNYIVGFSNLPLGYVATQSNGALNDATNSDMNPATGMTSTVTLVAGEYNPNLDAGIMKPTAHLGNYVWNDVNVNGIQDNGEVGVSGVTVSLMNSATNAILSTVQTDAYGYYQFSNLAPGTYKVQFSLPTNYVFTPANNVNDATDSDPSIFTGMTADYTLVAGDSNMTVDAGIYQPLPVYASVGDRVWFDGNSNGIQDGTEQGVSGITVTLYQNGQPVATTITDATGHYLFENVVPGANYSVGFTAPGGMVFTLQNGPLSTTDNSDANPSTGITTPFTVNPGDNISYVDAGITPKPNTTVSIGDKVWNDANNNGIQDPNETGVAGVIVTLYDATGTNIIYTTTTNGLGNYGFNGFPAGCYVIGFSNLPSGYTYSAQNAGTDTSKNSDANATTGMTNQICVAAGQNNLTIDAGIHNNANTNSIGDIVWYDANKNGIQDATEYGYSGVVVTLFDNTNTPIATTVTNANGNYLFDGLANGDYSVGFGFVPGFQFTGANSDLAGILGANNSDANPSNGLTASVSLTGNTHITSVDAGIYPGGNRTATSSLGDIVWQDLNGDGVQNPGETGISGVKVILYGADGVTPIDSTVTDGSGNYIFTGLGSGNYVIGFSDIPSGYTFSPSTGTLENEDNSDANPTTGKTTVITLGAGEDKMNIDAGLVPAANTASLGNKVWIDLNHDGIQDANEPAVSGVTVKLYDASNNVISVATTNAAGNYLFSGLAAGTYSVGFENLPSGYDFTVASGAIATTNNSDANPTTGMTSSVTLVAGENNTTVDAGIYSSTKAVVGNYVWYDENGDGIQDPTEAPISGVLVTLYDNNNNPVASAVTDANGGYLFTNVTPGDYTIGFAGYPSSLTPTTKEANASSSTGSNVNPTTDKTDVFTVTGGTSNLTIDAGFKGKSIGGLGNFVWFDANEDGLQGSGEPGISGIVVTLLGSDNLTPLATAITTGEGTYSFPNLEAGDYYVEFSNIPTGMTSTQVVGTINDALNSDINSSNKTQSVTIEDGMYNPNIDAGFYIGIPLGVKALKATTAVIDAQNNNKCNVNWYTTDEQNTSYFTIERSIDSKNFQSVGTTSASTETKGNTNYTFNDDIEAVKDATIIYYRIRLTDIDGKETISNVINTRLNTGSDEVLIYPVPFTNQVIIDMNTVSNGEVTITLTDAIGQVVRQMTSEVKSGRNIITIDNLSDLSSGTYFIKINDDSNNSVHVRKLTK